jgi:hypothetical protein
MAFQQQENITKDGIEDFEVSFFVPGPGNIDGVQTGKVDYQILMSNGEIDGSNQVPDLLDRLTDDAEGLVHLSNLASLRDYIRTRLNNEVLPTP